VPVLPAPFRLLHPPRLRQLRSWSCLYPSRPGLKHQPAPPPRGGVYSVVASRLARPSRPRPQLSSAPFRGCVFQSGLAKDPASLSRPAPAQLRPHGGGRGAASPVVRTVSPRPS
jgi:hypothetical protein